MTLGFNKAGLWSALLFGVLFPWNWLFALVRGVEEEAGKRKKSGIGLI